MTELPSETPHTEPEPEPAGDPVLHWSRLKFFLTLNVAFAATGVGLLKMEGPWYVDGVVAGLFFVGFCLALSSRRALSAHAGQDRTGRSFLLALAIFYLAVCAVIVWLTFVTPTETPLNEDQEVRALTAPAAYSECDL